MVRHLLANHGLGLHASAGIPSHTQSAVLPASCEDPFLGVSPRPSFGKEGIGVRTRIKGSPLEGSVSSFSLKPFLEKSLLEGLCLTIGPPTRFSWKATLIAFGIDEVGYAKPVHAVNLSVF